MRRLRGENDMMFRASAEHISKQEPESTRRAAVSALAYHRISQAKAERFSALSQLRYGSMMKCTARE